jgi:hypothetical protein
MRIGLAAIVVTSFAAFTAFAAVGADTEEPQAVQGPETDAAVAPAAAPAPAPEQTTPANTSAQQAPVEAVAPETATAESGSTAPAAADAATPGDSTTSQPIKLKMATVPPPADFKIPAGYRPVKRGLDTVYCTSVTPIGSRLSKTYCLTQAQVEERQRQAELARRDVAQKTGTCDGGGCGAN